MSRRRRPRPVVNEPLDQPVLKQDAAPHLQVEGFAGQGALSIIDAVLSTNREISLMPGVPEWVKANIMTSNLELSARILENLNTNLRNISSKEKK